MLKRSPAPVTFTFRFETARLADIAYEVGPASELCRQDERRSLGDDQRVFAVGGETAVARAKRPAVGILDGIGRSGGDHRATAD